MHAATDWTGPDNYDKTQHPLYPLFYPRSVAVVGASPKGGYGLSTLKALTLYGFAGSIYPVNPNYKSILDLPAYPDLGSIPEPVDVVIVAVPSRAVPGVVQQAIAAGARSGVAFGSGFAESGEDGQNLQAELRAMCANRFPLIGPNCLGVMSYLGSAPLWAIPLGVPRSSGRVGLVAQSGNIALTQMVYSRGLHLAHVVSAGNQAVVDAVDAMSFFLSEPDIRAVAAVIEGISDIEKFRKVAIRAAERDIPIVVLKLGRSEKAAQAAVAHTGSLTGADQLYDALFRQYGVIRVDEPDELAETVKLLADDRRPRGGGLGVFASSGGECGLLSDLAAATGVELPDLSPNTTAAIAALLPSYATPLNPLDITAGIWGNRDVYDQVATLLAGTTGVDIVACAGDATRKSGPLEATGWDQMIAALADTRAKTDKPVALINTVSDVAPAMTDMLGELGVIQLSGARNALNAIGHAGRYARWRQESRTLTKVPLKEERRQAALELLRPAGSGGLPESASKDLLRLYGIAIPAGGLASCVEQALEIACGIGFPLVLKIEAEGIHHKTEVGGIALGITSNDELRLEYAALLDRVASRAPDACIHGVRVERMERGLVELIAGGRNDPVFGPVVVAGLGGIMAEALQDVSTRLGPVDSDMARAMLAELHGSVLLGPFRGRKAVDIDAVAEVIARVSQLLCELPEVRELDLNPIIASETGCIAVDALVVV